MNLQLDSKEYKQYLVSEETIEPNLGAQYKFRFENNYGASVIKCSNSFFHPRGSYGYSEDLWELGVIYWCSDVESHLCYDTPIIEDVIGDLTDEEVRDILGQIKELED